jgi:hypothetical protein
LKAKYLLFVLISFLLVQEITAQVSIAKNYKGEYQLFTLYTGVDVAAADTSDIMQVPYAVKEGIFYLYADTVTTSDTLKSIVIQVSPDAVNWYASGLTLANVAAAGGQRVAATITDKYYRLIFTVAGSGVKIDFSLKFLPK